MASPAAIRPRSLRVLVKGLTISAWATVSRFLPRYSMRDTWVNGSSLAPNLLWVRRIPFATPRTFPDPWVRMVTILSASPSLIERRTMPCSL